MGVRAMMRRAYGMSIILACLLILAGCLSTPEGRDADAALPSGGAESAVATEAGASAEASNDSDAIDSSSTTPSAASAERQNEQAVVPTETGPEEPAETRLLYFYPEPEVAVAPAAPAPEATKPTEPAKSAERAKPTAPQKPATPKAPTAAPATAKSPAPEKATAPEPAEQPGIWEAEPTAPSIVPIDAAKPAAAPSRETRLERGQALEVWYPGTGWVFLGDASAQNGLRYESRKLDGGDTLFTFRALRPGDYILTFSKFDVLKDEFFSDALAVSVADETGKPSDRVRAPDYRAQPAAQPIDAPVAAAGGATGGTARAPSPSSARDAQLVDEPAIRSPIPLATEGAASDNAARAPGAQTPAASAVSAKPALQEDVSALAPADILARSQAALASGDGARAIALLDAFFVRATDGLDEGWFLRGQAYEANGPARDIRKAMDAYRTVVDAFPESSRWAEADARARYLKQFYQSIR